MKRACLLKLKTNASGDALTRMPDAARLLWSMTRPTSSKSKTRCQFDKFSAGCVGSGAAAESVVRISSVCAKEKDRIIHSKLSGLLIQST